MTKRGSTDVGFFLVGGRSLLGVETKFDDSVEAVLQMTRPLGQAAAKYEFTGQKKATASQQGFFDDAADSVNDAFNGKEGIAQVVCYGEAGNVAGRLFTGAGGKFAGKYDRVISGEGFHQANAQYTVTGALEKGVILHAHGAETAAGNSEGAAVDQASNPRVAIIPIASSSVASPTLVTTTVPHGLTTGDKAVIAGHTSTPTINGERQVTVVSPTSFTVPVNVTVGGSAGGTVVRAMSTNGGSAYLQVQLLTLGGYTNAVVKVRHSADNSVFADLVSFTAVTTAPTAERKVVAAGTTVNRYLAWSLAFTGSGTGPSITFMVGFVRS